MYVVFPPTLQSWFVSYNICVTDKTICFLFCLFCFVSFYMIGILLNGTLLYILH